MSIHASKRWIVVSNCADFAGNEPPFGKILAYDTKTEGVYLSATGAHLSGSAFVPGEDKFVTPAMMTRVRSFGLLAGCHFVPRSTDAISEARRASDMVTALNPDCVMLDIESHDLAFQRAFVAEYRRLKPGRATDVSFEPRQEPEWVDSQGKQHGTVAHLTYLNARMHLFPQLFRGDMRPADAKRECEVWSSAVGWDQFHLVHGAGLDWWALDDGCLFDAENLPDRRALPTRLLAKVPGVAKRQHDRARYEDWVRSGSGDRINFRKRIAPVQPCGEETQEKAA